MKYKRITSAIHNLGASFLGFANYWDDGYIVDDLGAVHRAGLDIEIDWLAGEIAPESQFDPRVRKSVEYLHSCLADQLASEAVDIAAIKDLRFVWPANGIPRMIALDDRGRSHDSIL